MAPTPTPAPQLPSYPPSIPPSLLLLILDIHPISWSILSSPPPPVPDLEGPGSATINRAPAQSVTLGELLNMLMVWFNSHLAARWGNELVVFAAGAGRSKQIYPPPPGVGGPSDLRSNVYQPFNYLDHRLEEGLKGMIEEEEAKLDGDLDNLNEPPSIVSALTKALCFINRVIPQDSGNVTLDAESANTAPDRLEPRIMVINATPTPTSTDTDTAAKGNGGGGKRGGYVGMMNCVFAAQKAKVPIDVLTLPPLSGGSAPPIFLQQAAYLTQGIYWRWNGRIGLLQYLHTIYLSPPSLRQKPFALPPQDAVDFRAVCFCHQDVVDVGFVCSVCLSIYCKPLPVCQMCKTKFPYKSLPLLKALAANIQPIPIPQTIPMPSAKKGQPQTNGGARPAAPKGKSKATRDDPMEVD